MNVPKLRFKEFDGEWSSSKLGEIAEVKDSARISNEYWLENGIPYLRSSDLVNDDLKGELFISKETYDKYASKTGAPEKDDMLFTSGGKIGVVYHKEDNSLVYVQGGAVLYVKTSKSKILEGAFLSTYFSTYKMKKYIENASAGGTIKHFTLKPANAAPISFPTNDEQIKIGEFFKKLDKKIQLQQQKIDLLQEQKYSFLNRLFPKKVSAEPLLRNPKFDGEWSKVKLAEVVDHVKSYSLSRDVEKIEDTGMKYVHYGDIHTKVANIIVANSNLPNIELGDYITLEKGDLILADASEDYKGIAEPAILTIQPDYKLVAGLHTIALRPIDIDSFFLYYLFKSSAFKEYGYRIGTGMKVFGITANNVLNFEFMLPSIEEQRFIGNFLKSLDDKIDLQIRKLAVLKNQKQGFMQQMFI